MKTIIKLLLGLALIAISLTSCNTDEPTLDEKKQAETVVTPEMLYGTWVLSEMYSVNKPDSTKTQIIFKPQPDTTICKLVCDTIKFNLGNTYAASIVEWEYDAVNNSLILSKDIYFENLILTDNYITWDYISIIENSKAKIAIVNGKLVMNTEIIGNKYIFSIFTKQ